ncbi:MAG: hypothetical protein CEE38_05315 [Planctomycetes bacterium B3_Pla]|nr:MAG: hypothetical protein CEE38_05315 [Planctomycetes bacterium B3_Pla]
MRFYTKINSLLGLLAAGLLSLFGKSPAKPAPDDLKRADFPTSTQRLGIRFSETIRDVFRFKWLKTSNRTGPSLDNRSEQSKGSRRIQ